MGSERRNYSEVRIVFWAGLPKLDQPGINSAQWAYRVGFKGSEAQRIFDHLLDGLQGSTLKLPLDKEPIPGTNGLLYRRGSEKLEDVSNLVIRQAERALNPPAEAGYRSIGSRLSGHIWVGPSFRGLVPENEV